MAGSGRTRRQADGRCGGESRKIGLAIARGRPGASPVKQFFDITFYSIRGYLSHCGFPSPRCSPREGKCSAPHGGFGSGQGWRDALRHRFVWQARCVQQGRGRECCPGRPGSVPAPAGPSAPAAQRGSGKGGHPTAPLSAARCKPIPTGRRTVGAMAAAHSGCRRFNQRDRKGDDHPASVPHTSAPRPFNRGVHGRQRFRARRAT